jgi:imidazoleglycerol phosphate synthase glutamine amidotransferase subunit HisH
MLYTTVVIPGIRTVADPMEEETRLDQTEALRVLAAGNTLIVICLGLVIALQAGQEWARRTEAKALADAAAGAAAAPSQQRGEPVGEQMETVAEKS